MILWENLTFWTAIGSLVVGGVLGLTVGLVVKEIRRLALPPDAPLPHRGVCPSCGALSLRRLHCRASQRAMAAITRHWPYGCLRCGWRSTFPVPEGRIRAMRLRPDPELATIIDAGPVLPRDRKLRPAPLPEPKPERDEVAEVRAAVMKHLDALNAGDAEARAKFYVSDATGFDFDNGPMATGRSEAEGPHGSGGQLRDLQFRDLRINIHKDAAVATGYLVGKIAMPGGRSQPIAGRSTWVHVRQNGTWKIAHTHLSPLSVEAPAPLR
jgi:ketosteroid isomerase-like protein